MPMRIVCLLVVMFGIAAASIVIAGPSAGDHSGPITPPKMGEAKDLPGIHNVILFGDGVYSGSVPEGDAGFDTLQALGIRTIISVDGARPDLERAKSRGMRYVHIPIQYSGIDDDDAMDLAKAMDTVERPIFMHCHHGKHRGPAATAMALVETGEMTAEKGVEMLKLAGTSPSYPGLYRCVGTASAIPEFELMAHETALPEQAQVSGMVEGMAETDAVWERLKLIQKVGWAAPRDHPDLVPAAEAGLLRDLLRTMHDDPEAADYPSSYKAMLKDSEMAALAIEEALVRGERGTAEMEERFAFVERTCKGCQVVFRFDCGRGVAGGRGGFGRLAGESGRSPIERA
ncbi:MAG: hypothetical protein VYC34_07180 [Planctomycetota bacterium]|nr:hypothetical protein [Planctomycetota bacterium]